MEITYIPFVLIAKKDLVFSKWRSQIWPLQGSFHQKSERFSIH